MRKFVDGLVLNHHKNKNKYIKTSNGVWVRDFTNNKKEVNINNSLSGTNDFNLYIKNETENSRLNLANIDSEQIKIGNCVIVSDGFDFDKKIELLLSLPKNVSIIAVNKSLAKWSIERAVSAFVVNNPFSDCVAYCPKHKYCPRCIVSSRTNPDFVRLYLRKKGLVYKYSPSPERDYSGLSKDSQYYVDDYRNPICAAINLVYRFGATKILLFCCDDSFTDERPGSERLENGLFQYPQQDLVHELIDANMFWIKEEIKLGDHSSGKVYVNASYITEKGILEFFNT